uniref:Cysteine rich secretory protein 1 n=1 Tax=Molossus molossus TaxID=27622 RepID=A0A7J8GNV9_MOLMO|nr:cysteine rich secretory protein 1 [Molossus molossus]
MKPFLLLAAATGFLPVLIVKVLCQEPLDRVSYESVRTDHLTVQSEIVNLHNALRRKVQPTAGNMLKMSWEEDAAANARELSKFCEEGESNAFQRRIKNTFCGENTYLTPYPISWSQVIGSWYNESKHFKYGKWAPAHQERRVRNYTQVVWATSYLIGCGASPCCKRKLPQYFYVCHYCHEGNDPELRNKPYRLGNPCKECPQNCDNKLCTNPCLFYDEYTDCKIQTKVPGCSQLSVQLQCKASCFCKTEIL